MKKLITLALVLLSTSVMAVELIQPASMAYCSIAYASKCTQDPADKKFCIRSQTQNDMGRATIQRLNPGKTPLEVSVYFNYVIGKEQRSLVEGNEEAAIAECDAARVALLKEAKAAKGQSE